jgi:putative peptidoglycan lipid II flippase
MIPAIFAGGITQINILVDTIYASLLSSGSATWLYVSDRLIQFPLGIFAIAIGTVLLPTLSKLDISKDLNTFYKTIQNSINLVLLIAIPSLIALIVCANDFIMTLFYRGEFKIFDVLMASKSLVLLSAGIPFFMLMKILIPIFFSQEDTATPMKIAGISLVMNIFLNYFFAIKLEYGHVGLALSSTITAVISVFLAFYLLNKRMLLPRINFLNPFYFSLIISSFILAIFLIYFSKIIDFESLNQFKRFAFVIIEIFIGIFIYFSVIRIMLGNSLKSYIK